MKLNYEETGIFTKNQERLCEEIRVRIDKIRKSGCSVIAKQDCLMVFKDDEIQYSNLLNPGKSYSNNHPIAYLIAGYINDSGADDEEFFIDDALI